VEQSRQSSGDSSQRETDERQPETGSASAPRGSRLRSATASQAGVTGWRQRGGLTAVSWSCIVENESLFHGHHRQMHPKESRRDEGSPPQAALDFLLGSLGSVPPGRSAGRQRFNEEVAALQRWATNGGRCLNEDGLRGFKPVASGAEHEVFFDESGQRAIKVTKGVRGVAGQQMRKAKT